MTPAELEHKRILVAGCGATGLSVLRYLLSIGCAPELVDDGLGAAGVQAWLDKALNGKLAGVLDPEAAGKLRCHDRLAADIAIACDVIVLSPGIPRSHPAIVAALDAGRAVIGDVELFAAVVDRPVVAVTGSNGKSTVVAWLAHALGAAGIDAIACGNIGEPALEALAIAGEEAVFVLELSSYQLESTMRLAPLAASVLNVSDDHLDRYDSIDHYARVKRHVYDGARACIANADDPRTWPAAANDSRGGEFAGERRTGSGTESGTERRAELAGQSGDGFPGTLALFATASVRTSIDAPVDALWRLTGDTLWRGTEPLVDLDALKLPGRHNAANALAVLALADVVLADIVRADCVLDDAPDGLGGSDSRAVAALATLREQLLEGLVAFSGLPHRTELVAEAGGVRWYDDSKGTNVDACSKAIDAMPGPVVLIAGGIGKGADFRVLENVVARRVRAAILIGRDAAAIAAAIEGVTAVHRAASMAEAVRMAAGIARPGEAVLLSPACASFDMFSDFGDRGRQFAAAARATAA